MCPRAVFAAAMVFVVAGDALADADAERGRALAQRWCVSCHVVGPDQAGGDAGPSFVSVANREDQAVIEIENWLADPHPPMPDLGLAAPEYEDLAAYIMSLKE